MQQHALTIVTPILEDKAGGLRAFLTDLGLHINTQTVVPFPLLDLLHFASWVVIESDELGPQLVFESSFDGPSDGFLRQIAERARSGLDALYRSCPGYPASGGPDDVRRYLQRHAVYTDTFFVGCVGFSLGRIRAEAQLRERIETFLDTQPLNTLQPADLLGRIQRYAESQADLQWARLPPEGVTFGERIRLWTPVVIVAALLLFALGLLVRASGWMGVLALAGLGLLLLLAGYVTLRVKERSDPVDDQQADVGQVNALVRHEDFLVQNHLASVTEVKPGLFRYLLLEAVLAVVNLAARYVATKGNIAGIPSIHFGRWAMINRGRQLLFLSNFDGSWEHYLGEFVDRAGAGLTAVWSNTVGFPRSKNLVGGGAALEEPFKHYARRHQTYTNLWYSAYPFLSVENILNNAAIREKLFAPMQGAELDGWLRRF